MVTQSEGDKTETARGSHGQVTCRVYTCTCTLALRQIRDSMR